MIKSRKKEIPMQDEIIPPIHDGQPGRDDFMIVIKPNDRMSDEEVLERMNQLYGEYTLYWNEYAKRTQRGKKGTNESSTKRVMSDGRGGVYEI